MALPAEPAVAIPEWATVLQVGGDGNNNRYDYMDETDDHIEDGWDYEEIPPYDIQNHQQYAVGEWLTWDYDAIQDLDGRVVTLEGAETDAIRSMTIVVASASSLDGDRADYICDGTADEVQVNAAIADIVAGGVGGTILLLEGQYNIADDIAVNTGVEIVGRNAVLKLEENVSIGTKLINITADNCILRGLTLDGTRQDQLPASYPPNIYIGNAAKRTRVLECNINYARGSGIEMEDDVDSFVISRCRLLQCGTEGQGHGFIEATTTTDHENSIISDCYFQTDAAYGGATDYVVYGRFSTLQMHHCTIVDWCKGIYLNTSYYATLDSLKIDDCEATSGNQDAIHLDASQGCFITNCRIDDTTLTNSGWAIKCDNGSGRHRFVGNNIESMGYGGIYIDDPQCHAASNIIYGVGSLGPSNGIHCHSNSYDNQIIGNYVVEVHASAIYLGCNNNIVANNKLSHYGREAHDSGYDGVKIGAYANNVINNNWLWRGSSGNRGEYGINIGAGATNTAVNANFANDSGTTGDINDAGTTSRFFPIGVGGVTKDTANFTSAS